MSRVVLIAPFWNQPDNVGLRRVQAMRRWLRGAEHEVVVVSAGDADATHARDWGVEVCVRDPRGAFGSLRAGGTPQLPLAGLWRLLGALRDNPDTGVTWARAVANHPEVRRHAEGARLVVSSSPPESAHVAGRELARVVGGAHVVDLQDGWLDEPLKPVLQRVALRRWQEGRLERTILGSAAHVLVTSEVWAERLRARLPVTAGKLTTLHSAYPPAELQSAGSPDPEDPRGLRLLHAGTFTLSHNARRIELLLGPLRDGLADAGARGEIQLLGRLQDFERAACDTWAPRFQEIGWTLAVTPPVPREVYLEELPRMHGLLLLSASMGALPSKLFEYLTTGRPVLTLTPEGSAVWRIAEDLPALHRLDYTRPSDPAVVGAFLAAARNPAPLVTPPQFTEEALGRVFLDALRPHLDPA